MKLGPAECFYLHNISLLYTRLVSRHYIRDLLTNETVCKHVYTTQVDSKRTNNTLKLDKITGWG